MALSVKRLKSFVKDYEELPEEGKRKAEATLTLLIENPRHPSLQVKKIQGTQGIWEVRMDLKRRITFQWEGSLLILRRVGFHNVIEKEARKGVVKSLNLLEK